MFFIKNVQNAKQIRDIKQLSMFFIPEPKGIFPNGEVISALESEYKMSINYFHSFGMTENYYVYVEQPMYINILKILTKKLTESAVDTAIDFYDNINVSIDLLILMKIEVVC